MKYIDSKKLHGLSDSDEIQHLDDLEDLEDLIVVIDSLDTKEAFLNRLKRTRVSQINNEMSKVVQRKERLKEIIKATLANHGQKSLSFPGVGKVSCRKVKPTWDIIDEKGLVQELEERLSEGNIENVIQTEKKIIKKGLNKVLDLWEKTTPSTLPEGVRRKESKVSVIVSVEKDIVKAYDDDEVNDTSHVLMEDLDNLEV